MRVEAPNQDCQGLDSVRLRTANYRYNNITAIHDSQFHDTKHDAKLDIRQQSKHHINPLPLHHMKRKPEKMRPRPSSSLAVRTR